MPEEKPSHTQTERQDMTSVVSGANPRQLLVAWANEQDAWVRNVVGDVLTSKQPLTGEALDGIYVEFLAEKGLTDVKATSVPPLEDVEDVAQIEDRLELVSLSDVRGVNALAADQRIEFDSSITVLFGENGAGKTGYARILKRLAAVRTAEDILPDVNLTEGAAGPESTLTFKLGDATQHISWRNETGLQPFTRMSVFDAPCVNIHVDSELNYVYTPVELALFGHIAEAVRGIQARAESEANAIKPVGNAFVSRFAKGTRVYPLIEMIGATSDVAALTTLGTLSAEEKARRATLEGDISALRGRGLNAVLKATTELSTRLRRAIEAVQLAEEFDFSAYEGARRALRGFEDARRQARSRLFTADELAGQPDDEWQSFISSAEAYKGHLGLEEYPQEGDNCLYCRQRLSEESRALIGRYSQFLDDALAGQVDDARATLDELVLRPGGVEVQVVQADIEALKTAEPKLSYIDDLDVLLTDLKATVAATADFQEAPSAGLSKRASASLVALKAARQIAEQAVTTLTEQVSNTAEALRAAEVEFSELDARATLNTILPTALGHVASAKRAAQLTGLAKGLSSSVLRRLTELSKLASEDLVNQDFERLFREECQALRAPDVALAFQGRRGKAERKKVVAQYRPSAILSEGEQKVLALADFLAEGRMGTANAPIIFDDPVTSLDYKRMAEVATRISILGETHQVVVLTHNIMFASALLGLRESKKLRCKFYEIRENNLVKGFVQPAAEPRSDTCKDFESKINVLLDRINSADPIVRDALLSAAYGLLRSWCEAFVEQELLQSVSQRYRVNVMMTNLPKIRGERLASTCADLMPIFDRCSRFMPGHAQPVEQLNVQANVDDFRADYGAAKALRKAYSLP